MPGDPRCKRVSPRDRAVGGARPSPTSSVRPRCLLPCRLPGGSKTHHRRRTPLLQGALVLTPCCGQARAAGGRVEAPLRRVRRRDRSPSRHGRDRAGDTACAACMAVARSWFEQGLTLQLKSGAAGDPRPRRPSCSRCPQEGRCRTPPGKSPGPSRAPTGGPAPVGRGKRTARPQLPHMPAPERSGNRAPRMGYPAGKGGLAPGNKLAAGPCRPRREAGTQSAESQEEMLVPAREAAQPNRGTPNVGSPGFSHPSNVQVQRVCLIAGTHAPDP